MSQELNILLRKKDNPDTSINLIWYCTTPARQISYEGVLTYTENEIELTALDVKDIIMAFNTRIDEIKESIEDINNRICELKEVLKECQSKESIQEIIEKIEDRQNAVNYYKEDLKSWESRLTSMKFIEEVYSLNSKDWKLYYSNC